jgi:hypothetical protein
MNQPSRTERQSAWTVLMRQAEYLSILAETMRYGDTKNPYGAVAVKQESDRLLKVADWLRDIKD